jgi:hypothetical protein
MRFAEQDSEFRDFLVGAILEHLSMLEDVPNVSLDIPVSQYLVPQSCNAAQRRTYWVLNEILLSPYKYLDTAMHLRSWAQQHQTPQSVVLGNVGLAIIGPTLGLVEKKKKKKSQLRIVVDETLEQTLSKKQFSELTQAATIGLLGNEIAAVNGNTNRLDPDMAEWLFADKETQISFAAKKSLTKLHHVLTNEQLPHFCVATNRNLQALAIAPVVSDTFCPSGLDT